MASITPARLEARLRFLYAQVSAEIGNRDWRAPPRPFAQFIDRFTVPRPDTATVANRILLNSHIYQTNYCLILGAALLYCVLRHPSAVFVVGCIIVACVAATSPTPLLINGRRITRNQKFPSVTVLSLLALVLSGVLFSFLYVLSLAFAVILLHACLRHTSIRNKVGEIRTHMADRW